MNSIIKKSTVLSLKQYNYTVLGFTPANLYHKIIPDIKELNEFLRLTQEVLAKLAGSSVIKE